MEKINFRKLKKPYIIAEIGGNHTGKLNNSILGIKNAKKSGANCVKFQMYKADKLVVEKMPLMPHVKKISNEKTQFERFKSLEITESDVSEMYKTCKRIKIDFSVTPFYSESVKFLSKYVSFFKVASGDINFLPLLEEISKYKKPVVLSTGMSNKKEITEALKILKRREVILLHCISSYPTLDHQLNLKTFEMLRNFNKVVGLSDHTKGVEGAKMSLACGAMVFEKHFLPHNKIKKVGDIKLSLNPLEMKSYVYKLNNCYKLIGEVRNGPTTAEKKFFKNLRRSPYFSRLLKKGTRIKKNDIIFLRPYNPRAININMIKKVLGKKLRCDVKKQALIQKRFFFR